MIAKLTLQFLLLIKFVPLCTNDKRIFITSEETKMEISKSKT